MAAGTQRWASNACPQDEQLQPSYQAWKAARPQLFHRPQSSPSMAGSNSPTSISVMANGQETIIKLNKAVRDEALQSSLISATKASATKGKVKPNTVTTFTDQHGKVYQSNGTITLRWYYENGMQTFEETFHIVDRLDRPNDGGEWDVVLRRDIPPGPERRMPQANPICYAPGMARLAQQKKEKVERDKEKYQAQKQAQMVICQAQIARKQAEAQAAKQGGK